MSDTPASGGGRALAAVGLLLVAFNLRPVFASLSAVLPEMLAATGASATTASLATTLPVFCLGVFAPVAPRLAGRFGVERTIAVLLVVLGGGTALRGVGLIPAIVAGSMAAGLAIAMMNVLLPGLIKRDFPHRTAVVTGLYAMALCAGAALAAGTTAPLALALPGGWPSALAFWAAPVAVAAIVWAPQALRSTTPGRGPRGSGRALLASPLAWQVTLFMGTQSALAYCVFGWLSPILRERGMDAVPAGWVVSTSIFAQVAASLVAPAMATRGRDQRATALLFVALTVGGLGGILAGPLPLAWGFAVLTGLGQGGLFAVAMMIIILRAPDPATAAHLSGMAQGFGYVLAGFGPLLVGVLHETTGGFGAVGLFFVAIGAACALAGLGAGRRLQTPAI